VPISPELEERVSAAWFESIPEQYRQTDKDKGLCGDRFLSAAIILPPPPLSLIETFLMNIFGERHLTQKQLAARVARQNIGRAGRKKADTIAEGRPSRARQKRSAPLMTFTELSDATKPYHDLDLLSRS